MERQLCLVVQFTQGQLPFGTIPDVLNSWSTKSFIQFDCCQTSKAWPSNTQRIYRNYYQYRKSMKEMKSDVTFLIPYGSGVLVTLFGRIPLVPTDIFNIILNPPSSVIPQKAIKCVSLGLYGPHIAGDCE